MYLGHVVNKVTAPIGNICRVTGDISELLKCLVYLYGVTHLAWVWIVATHNRRERRGMLRLLLLHARLICGHGAVVGISEWRAVLLRSMKIP